MIINQTAIKLGRHLKEILRPPTKCRSPQDDKVSLKILLTLSNFKSLFKSQMSNALGYTMIELMVVIVAMAIMGTIVFANYRTLLRDQALQKGVSDIQSFIKTAQTNATTRVPCPPTSTDPFAVGATWKVVFNTSTNITMTCRLSTLASDTSLSSEGSRYSYTLGNNVIINKINTTCDPASNLMVNFAPLYGTVTFADSVACPSSSIFLITLRNTTVGPTCATANACRTIVVDKGGSVYEQ